MQWKTLYPFHVKFIRNHRLMMLLLILLCFVCVAAQADDITQNCTFSALSKEKIFRLTDGKTAKSFEGKPYRENWIKVDPPSGKTICGLYMLWNESESEVLLDIWDAKKGDYVTYATVHTGVYLHEYLSLPGVASVRLRSTDKPGNIPLVELRVLSDGEIPDDIQIWEPPCTNADLLILVAHPDDELLFFGGTIPWYSLEKNLHVAVAYMTCKNTTRYHELLDGLWTAGIREYPHLVGLIDKSATVKMSTTRFDQVLSFRRILRVSMGMGLIWPWQICVCVSSATENAN